MVIGLSEVFVTIASTRATAIAEFYKSLTGTPPDIQAPGYVEFQLSGLRLAIFEPNKENSTEFKAHGSGSMSLCLEVADLEAAIALLTRMGYAPPGKIIRASHGREIYAYDPDGNRLILHQSPPSDSP